MSRLNQLQTLLAESPNDSFLLFAIAKEYEKAAEQEQALQQYLLLKEHHPDYVGLYYHLGKLYEQLNNPAQAFHTYKAGMNVARKLGDQHALSELAGAKLSLGDDDDFI